MKKKEKFVKLLGIRTAALLQAGYDVATYVRMPGMTLSDLGDALLDRARCLLTGHASLRLYGGLGERVAADIGERSVSENGSDSVATLLVCASAEYADLGAQKSGYLLRFVIANGEHVLGDDNAEGEECEHCRRALRTQYQHDREAADFLAPILRKIRGYATFEDDARKKLN